jgi:hypothetical protein
VGDWRRAGAPVGCAARERERGDGQQEDSRYRAVDRAAGTPANGWAAGILGAWAGSCVGIALHLIHLAISKFSSRRYRPALFSAGHNAIIGLHLTRRQEGRARGAPIVSASIQPLPHMTGSRCDPTPSPSRSSRSLRPSRFNNSRPAYPHSIDPHLLSPHYDNPPPPDSSGTRTAAPGRCHSNMSRTDEAPAS